MTLPELSSILIIGAGQMGSGIAFTCASSGYKVILGDADPSSLAKAQQYIEKTCATLISKEKLTSEASTALRQNLTYTSKWTAHNDCQLVIEAISEREDLKKQLFRQLDEQLPASCMFASNTSSIAITQLAAATRRPERFIGLHFMNPVPRMRLLEVIPGLATSEETLAAAKSFAASLDKHVVVSRDFPGFIVNRVLMPMINEAFNLLMEGVASREDIDAAMQLGTNQPMGPLALADFIGLDTCLSILEIMHEGLSGTQFKPSPLLRQYVAANWYGRKSGRGVYTYTK